MNKMVVDDSTIKAMIEAYDTGQTVKLVAEQFGLSAGKVYYLLRDNGCKFRAHSDYHFKLSKEAVERISRMHKGKRLSDDTKRKIADKRKSHYNGFNGIGHLKQHQSGYILAYVPEHPHATKDGYVMLHTVIMERAIGRYLESNEEVHHINHIKADNRLENLRLMTKYEHHSMHMRERNAQKKGMMTY